MKRALALILLAACGDGAAEPGACWPLASTPGGSILLGSGDDAFEPMPDTVPIIRSLQAEPFVFVHGRMRGMPPGDPDDFLAEHNPHTKVSMVVPSLEMTYGTECPASIGYVPASSGEAGSFDLAHPLRLGLGFDSIAPLDGQQATITIEIVGDNGLYARNEKPVVLAAPPAM